jgi:hypothetical protein
VRIDIERQPRQIARAAIHIEFEDARNHEDALRPMSVLEHGKPERLGPIDEDSAAHTALVLNDPITLPVLADQKERRSRTWGFDLSHGTFSFVISSRKI